MRSEKKRIDVCQVSPDQVCFENTSASVDKYSARFNNSQDVYKSR